MIVNLVVTGQDSAWRDVFGLSPIETRATAAISLHGYRITSLHILETSNPLSSSLEYQAQLTIDTQAQPAGAAVVSATIGAAFLEATGYAAVVSNLTAGDPSPIPIETGTIDKLADLVNGLARGLNVTVQTAQVLIVVIGIGAAGLIYFAVKNPERAARLVR
jgi:hypothetical protein